MHKSEKGDNLAKSGHLHLRHNLCVKYHDSSSGGSLDILLTRSHRLQRVSLKRGIIHSNIQRILRKVNQVICIMYPNSMPDIIILAQAVLQVLC